MSLKIRLARRGRKKRPYYHIIIADARAPRDGKFIDKIGSYNPMTKPATIELDNEAALTWLEKGAQPTNTARAILRFKGVMYRKHLLRGVEKGAFSMDEADRLYKEWLDAKDQKVQARVEETQKEKEAFNQMVFGVPGAKKQLDPTPADASEILDADAEDAPSADEPAAEPVQAAEETPAPVAEEPAKVEEQPAAEEPAKTEEPAKVEEPVAEKEEKAPEAAPAPVADPDDLTKIEGIGPAIAKVLNAGGIATFSALAASNADALKEILANAEGNFAMHDPGTWSQQADMAAKGEWDALKKWQDELDGGKPAGGSEQE